jgi:hypothetical protein
MNRRACGRIFVLIEHDMKMASAVQLARTSTAARRRK